MCPVFHGCRNLAGCDDCVHVQRKPVELGRTVDCARTGSLPASSMTEVVVPRPGEQAWPGWTPWVFTARTPDGVRVQASKLLRATADARTRPDKVEIARALARPGLGFAHRTVVLGASVDELLAKVTAVAEGDSPSGAVSGTAAGSPERTVFVFPGQGAHWAGMAAGLLRSSTAFAEAIGQCEEALAPHVDWSLSRLLGDPELLSEPATVDLVQPALFSVMVALARVWRECGVEPAAVVGHSQGEIAAAHVAGALSLADAARIVAVRSSALRALRGRGAMLAVLAAEAQVEAMLAPWADRLAVGAVNGPAVTTVSGDLGALGEFEKMLAGMGILRWWVPGVDFAAHSPQVEGLADELLALADVVSPVRASVPFYSTVTGTRLDTAALDAEYWYRNLRQPVRFDRAVQAMLADGYRVFLECGPTPMLSVGMQDIADAAGQSAVMLATLRRDDGDLRRLLTALAEAYVHGVSVDWATVLAWSSSSETEETPRHPQPRATRFIT